MLINTSQSVILLSVTQPYAKKWRRREILSGQEGAKLRVSTDSAGVYHLPIVETRKYLGAIISYTDDCTQLTISHRLQQAWAAWSHLRPALTSASAPALPLRLHLWKACVPPIALYALDSLPLQQSHIVQVQQVLTRQLRAVAKSQAHITHESTIHLHRRLRVPLVHDVLCKAAVRSRTRCKNALRRRRISPVLRGRIKLMLHYCRRTLLSLCPSAPTLK